MSTAKRRLMKNINPDIWRIKTNQGGLKKI